MPLGYVDPTLDSAERSAAPAMPICLMPWLLVVCSDEYQNAQPRVENAQPRVMNAQPRVMNAQPCVDVIRCRMGPGGRAPKGGGVVPRGRDVRMAHQPPRIGRQIASDQESVEFEGRSQLPRSTPNLLGEGLFVFFELNSL